MTKIKLIKTQTDYKKALARLEELFNVSKGHKDYDEAELLMALVELYENEKYPIEAPDPIEAIKFRMEQMDLKRTDLYEYLGARSRVSEILNRKRKLTADMMRKLHRGLGIPAESLLA